MNKERQEALQRMAITVKKKQRATQRKAEQRRRLEESGLVPLRITEVWCTPQQHEYLRLKIAAMIAETLKKPAE